MPIGLSLAVPQVEDVAIEGDERLDYQPWSRILAKSCEGSEKVNHLLRYAARALVETAMGERGWDDRPSEEYDAALAATISPEPPFRSPEEMLDALRVSGHLTESTTSAELVHVREAARSCLDSWSGERFAALCGRVMWGSRYEPEEALAAFLFLMCAWASVSNAGGGGQHLRGAD